MAELLLWSLPQESAPTQMIECQLVLYWQPWVDSPCWGRKSCSDCPKPLLVGDYHLLLASGRCTFGSSLFSCIAYFWTMKPVSEWSHLCIHFIASFCSVAQPFERWPGAADFQLLDSLPWGLANCFEKCYDGAVTQASSCEACQGLLSSWTTLMTSSCGS